MQQVGQHREEADHVRHAVGLRDGDVVDLREAPVGPAGHLGRVRQQVGRQVRPEVPAGVPRGQVLGQTP
jgi:hypothetical protein